MNAVIWISEYKTVICKKLEENINEQNPKRKKLNRKSTKNKYGNKINKEIKSKQNK